MMSVFTCLLCTLAHIPSLIFRYIPFHNKTSKKQRIVLIFVYIAALLINFVLCFALTLHGGLTVPFFKINLVAFCMLMAVVNIIVVRGFWKEHLFAFGLTAIVVLILFSLAAFLTGKLIPTDIIMQLIVCNLFLLTFFMLSYYPVSRLIKSTITPFLGFKDKSYWNTLWFIPISMFFAVVISNPMDSHVDTLSQLIARMFLGIATLFICFSIAPDYKRFMEREQMNQQIWLQKQYYAALTEKVNSEREMRHNFKHHMVAIRGFIGANNNEGLLHYCEELEASWPQDIQIPYTGNAAADGVMYQYAVMAAKESIRFEVQCSLENISLPDIDLCSILGNALDNAVTACKAYDGKRYIKIASEISGGLLLITVDNSFNGILQIENGKILSSKREHEEGIGIASMKKICADHGGRSKFVSEQTRFEASFLFPI